MLRLKEKINVADVEFGDATMSATTTVVGIVAAAGGFAIITADGRVSFALAKPEINSEVRLHPDQKGKFSKKLGGILAKELSKAFSERTNVSEEQFNQAWSNSWCMAAQLPKRPWEKKAK